MTMEAHEFTGWIEKIYPAGEYGQEFTVRDYKDASDKPQYPQTLKFNASNKCRGQIASIAEGDKVRVKFFIYGVSGEGRNGYYCIVRLNIAKDGGVTILERAERYEEPKTEEQEPEEDLPF